MRGCALAIILGHFCGLSGSDLILLGNLLSLLPAQNRSQSWQLPLLLASHMCSEAVGGFKHDGADDVLHPPLQQQTNRRVNQGHRLTATEIPVHKGLSQESTHAILTDTPVRSSLTTGFSDEASLASAVITLSQVTLQMGGAF